MNNKKRLEPNRHLDRRDGSAFKNSLKLTYFTIAQQQKDPRSEQPQFERPGLHLLKIQKQPQDYESSGHFNIVPMTSVRLDTPRNNHRITKSDLGWGIWGALILWPSGIWILFHAEAAPGRTQVPHARLQVVASPAFRALNSPKWGKEKSSESQSVQYVFPLENKVKSDLITHVSSGEDIGLCISSQNQRKTEKCWHRSLLGVSHWLVQCSTQFNQTNQERQQCSNIKAIVRIATITKDILIKYMHLIPCIWAL